MIVILTKEEDIEVDQGTEIEDIEDILEIKIEEKEVIRKKIVKKKDLKKVIREAGAEVYFLSLIFYVEENKTTREVSQDTRGT